MSISLSVRLIYDPEFKALFFPQDPVYSLFPRHYNPLSHSQLQASAPSVSPEKLVN